MVRSLLLIAICAGALCRGLAAQEPGSKQLVKYAALGAATGALTGAVAGPLLFSPSCRASRKTPDKLGTCADDLFFGSVGERARSAALFAGIGAGVGLIAGAIFGRDHARTVEVGHADGGVSLGVSLTF